MELQSMVNRLTDNADKLGLLIGTFRGSDSGITDVISSVQNAVAGQVHLPNFNWVSGWAGKYLTPTIMAYIAGEVMDVLNVPIVGKFASPLKKAAIGYGAASFGVHVLWNSTHADQGSDPTRSGTAPRVNTGISRGYPTEVTPTITSVYQ